MIVNQEKSKIVHFRKKAVASTVYDVKHGDGVLDIVDKYKYQGVVLEEYLDFSKVVDCLAIGGSHALGAINLKV